MRLLPHLWPDVLVPDDPVVLKYLHEEPTLLPHATPNDADSRRSEGSDSPSVPLDALLDDGDAHRGYLAGTNLPDDAVGLTTLPPAAYVPPLMEALGRAQWARCTAEGTVESLDDGAVREHLRAPGETAVLVTAETNVPAERITAVAGRGRQHALPALLNAAHAVFFPEPARDGHDWTLFSQVPMRERFVTALRAHPTDGARRFVLPFEHVRSKSKFYFETWQLTEPPLPNYVEEV